MEKIERNIDCKCSAEDEKVSLMWMKEALMEAKKAFDAGEVPVGAVAVYKNELLVKAHNLVESLQDASAHAELLVLKKAAAVLGTWRLDAVDIYVTIEPCPMCAMAMVLFRVRSLVYGAAEPRTGAAGSFCDLLGDQRLNHCVRVTSGIGKEESSAMITQFFKQRRCGNLQKKRVNE